MKVYPMELNELQAMCNDAAGLVIGALYNDGLTEWTPEMAAADYAIVVHEKGAFGKLFDRLFKHPEGALALRVISLGPLKGEGK